MIAPLRKLLDRLAQSHDRREAVVYAIVWGTILVALPATRLFYFGRNASAVSIDWSDIGMEYLSLLPFAALFIFNDLVLSVIVTRLRKVVLYVVLAIASALLMTLLIELFRSPAAEGREPAHSGVQDRFGDNPPPKPWERDIDNPAQGGDSISAMQPFGPRPDDDNFGNRPPEPPHHGNEPDWQGGGQRMPEPPDKPDGMRRGGPQESEMRSVGTFRVGPMMSDFILAMLMLCAGTLVKLYLLSDRDKDRLRQLARERSEAELAQLRYQLSPHFMMNALNNIHALVDIDAERAKDTIVRMSRLMRYMLYESTKDLTPLDSEVAFIRDYVELMRIRYTDNVTINLSLPTETFGVRLPPLLFINMVENAFKHGVSYAEHSFVDVSLSLSDDHKTVNFCCTNSLAPARPADSQHGIGLANTRKRLELLCPGRFQLSAVKLADRYVVTLSLSLE